MKHARASAVLLFLSNCFYLFGGTTETLVEPGRSDFNPPRFEFAIESAYLLGAINAPASYDLRSTGTDGQFDTPDDAVYTIGTNPVYTSGLTASLRVTAK